MNAIGDHPAIARTLATGYPRPENERPVICAGCETELYDEDEVFDWDGEKLCCDCCRDAILENYSVADIAKLVGLCVCEAGEVSADD